MNTNTPPNPMFKKKDPLNQPIIGFLSGLLMYIIAIIVLYYIRNQYNPSIRNMIRTFTIIDNPYTLKEASKLLSLGLIGLLAPFWWHLSKNRYFATRGVLIVAFIGVAFIFIYNFIL